MFRAVQQARQGVRPPNVDDPDFVLEQRWIELANFFRGEVTVKKARHFIFVTNTQLKFMSEAYAWYIDGTFKICRDPVKQLLTIHVVMNVADQRVSLPVCFVLMSRRRQIDHFAVLSEINRLCCKYIQDHSKTGCDDGPKVRKVMADFEIALWKAWRDLVENCVYDRNLKIKGCYFHFTQAVFRKIMHFTLKRDYFQKENSGARVIMKWLMSLVLLPAELIKPTFESLYEKIKQKNCTNLSRLFKYYSDNWINGPNWSISDICQWGCHVRTNNDAERFHMKLMSRIEKTSVDFYQLANVLGRMALNAMSDARSHAMGLLHVKPRKNILNFEQQLSEASHQLVRKEINSFQFLNKLCSMKHDNQLVDETWGLQHSRIDIQPEVELTERNYESTDSEVVDSDVGASN